MRVPLILSAALPLIAWGQTPVTAVGMSWDGRQVFAGHADGTIRAYDGEMRTSRWTAKSEGSPSRLTVTPDGRMLGVAFSVSGTWRNVRLFDPRDGKFLRSLGVGAAVAFSRDSKLVAVGGPSGLVIVDLASNQVVRRFELAGLVLNVAFDPKSDRMAYSTNGTIQVLSTTDWRGLGSVRMPTFDALQLGFTADGGLAAAVPRSGQLFRWNLTTGDAKPTLSSKFAQPVAASIAPDGLVGAFVGTQNEVETFDLVKGERLMAPRLGGGYANSLAVMGNVTAMGTLEGQVRWAGRPAARVEVKPTRMAEAIGNAIIKRKPDVMIATTVLGTPVRYIQVDLKRPNVEVGIEVAKGFPQGAESFGTLVARARATVAITGTFFDTISLKPVGDIVNRGDVLYRGHMGTALALTADNEPFMKRVPFGRTQDWSGFDLVLGCGPALVLDGEVDVDASGEGFRDPSIFATVPRVGVGFTADRRLLFVATGALSFSGFAKVMKALECTHAMNLDAGSSRALHYRGKTLISPGRSLTNILFVRIN